MRALASVELQADTKEGQHFHRGLHCLFALQFCGHDSTGSIYVVAVSPNTRQNLARP